MCNHSFLPESLRGEALKTTTYILNKVPSKAVINTLYELWMSKKPSIRHLNIRGCPAEARSYKLNERTLDSRTVSCYFVGYSERLRGFKFYNPMTRTFFENGNARFLKEVEFVEEDKVRNIIFEEEFVSLPTGAIDNYQAPILEIVQNANLEHQENLEELCKMKKS